MHIRYREDIDGLRCIAVSLVILYHSGFSTVSGGFIGVDIFFVISGYLISTSLFKDGDTGKLSITKFYERRVRRIVPAYSVVIVASLVAGYFLLLPSEFSNLAKSAVASSTFVANIYFWTMFGYFDGEPLSKPLLHMWSLAVEEQFYVVWPLVLIVLYRFGLQRFRLVLVLVGILVALSATEWMLGYSEKTAFYMAPLRAWELLLGGALAATKWPQLPNRLVAHVLGIVALALIFVPALTYNETMRFPGISALAPCLGAALLLYRDERYSSVAAWLLSMRVPVFVGLISYSLYLWHWPLLSFYWLAVHRETNLSEKLTLIVMTVGLATLSWIFVERPFRTGVSASIFSRIYGMLVGTTRSTLIFGCCSLVFVASLATAIVVARGFPVRLPMLAATVDGEASLQVLPIEGCILTDAVSPDAVDKCFTSANADQKRKVVIWGDSFARHHVKTLEPIIEQRGFSPLSVIATGCAPLAGVIPYFGKGRDDMRCAQFNNAVLQELANRTDVVAVIMAGRWSNLAGIEHNSTARYMTDQQHPLRTLANSLAVLDHALDSTISALERKHIAVVLVLEPPRYNSDVRPCVARALWRNASPSECEIDVRSMRLFRQALDPIFEHLTDTHPKLEIFDPTDNLCPSGRCLGYRNGELLTLDNGHLTPAGSIVALRNFNPSGF